MHMANTLKTPYTSPCEVNEPTIKNQLIISIYDYLEKILMIGKDIIQNQLIILTKL